MKINRMGIIIITLSLFFTAFNFNVGADETMIEPLHRQLDFDGDTSDWVYEEPDTSTGTTVLLWENFGGFWADAEKHPTNTEDDLACWAATCSNMLEWTGWGYVTGMEYGNTDTFFEYYQDHTTDKGSLNYFGLEWWFTGYLNDNGDPANWSSEDVEGADFWSSSYTWTNYVHDNWDNVNIPQNIETYITSGYPVGFAIYPITPPGGHAITCWGYDYDPAGTTPEEKYLGVWVTDSDSHKSQTDPDDVIRYYEIDFEDHGTGDTSDDYWYMPNYGSGWKISGVTALEPFPGETRPVADTGGPYTVDEGTAVSFNASASSDDDTLEYRWDFDADGTWDTLWSSIPTVSHTWYDDYSGEVYLEVFDGRLKDIDITTVTVNNVAPALSVDSDTIDENGYATISGTITDPGILDTFSLSIDWGEGSPDVFTYPAGTTSFSETHQYLDDNPTGTAYDDYAISVLVTDDEGDSDSDTSTVTVNNVAPTISAGADQTVNEGDTVYFSSSVTDPGTQDTHTYLWDFDDGSGTSSGTSPSYVYGDNGVFDVSLTVTDDDTGSDIDTMQVTVLNVPPTIDPLGSFTVDEYIPITFTATASDPGSDDLTFTWDYGDGTTNTETIYFNDGVSPDPYPSPDGTYPFSAIDTVSHTYGDNGVFTLMLTVEDDDGGVTVYTTTVTVNNVAPTITSEIYLDLPYPDNPDFILPVVHDLEFSATAYDPGSDDLTFYWDWDDGNSDTIIYYNEGVISDPYPSPEINPITVTDTISHTYDDPGTYTVTLTVTDDDGGSTTDTYTVVVLTIEEAKHDINDYIQDLPDDYFKGKADNRKNAFDNMFAAVDHMLDDENYEGMIDHLIQNIRSKCDGKVDGKQNNDWITDEYSQQHICAKIDDLVAYIATYL